MTYLLCRAIPFRYSVFALAMVVWLGACEIAHCQFTIGTNFTGSNRNQSGFRPPDTMGAVGPNHVVELINGRFAAYDRTGSLQTSSTLDAFWTSAGLTVDSFSFDPRIVYDAFSSRWFATAVDNSNAANGFLVGVSNSSDPTAGWSGVKVDSDADDSHWADFPMLGVNQDIVTVGANMIPLVGGSSNTGFIVIDKSGLISGTPTVTSFEDVAAGDTGFTAQPVFDLDNKAGSMRILSSFNKPAGFLKVSSIGGTSTSPTLNTANGFISVTSRGAPPDIDQPGTKEDIDSGNSRFASSVVEQHMAGRANPSLWAAQGVEINARAAIQWYEIDAVTNAVLQSGVIDDVSLGLNYPSIAVNDFGDVVIGFSGGDPNTFMSTYFVAGQTVAGVTTMGATTQSMAGVADYEALDTADRNRWGNYSSTVLDPNLRAIWTFQEFASATDVWSIQSTQIVFGVPEPSTAGFLGLATIGIVLRDGFLTNFHELVGFFEILRHTWFVANRFDRTPIRIGDRRNNKKREQCLG
jgi:hypothetical protein